MAPLTAPKCASFFFTSIILRAHPGRYHNSSKGSDNVQKSGRLTSHPINTHRVEVPTLTMDTISDSEQRLTSRDKTISFASMEGQLKDESCEPSPREDADRNV